MLSLNELEKKKKKKKNRIIFLYFDTGLYRTLFAVNMFFFKCDLKTMIIILKRKEK